MLGRLLFLHEKIKIGLLIPLTGEDKLLGKLLVQSTQIALEDIGNDKVEIYPRDTASDPKKTLASAIELKELGVQIVIGPIFYKNLVYLHDAVSLQHPDEESYPELTCLVRAKTVRT